MVKGELYYYENSVVVKIFQLSVRSPFYKKSTFIFEKNGIRFIDDKRY